LGHHRGSLKKRPKVKVKVAQRGEGRRGRGPDGCDGEDAAASEEGCEEDEEEEREEGEGAAAARGGGGQTGSLHHAGGGGSSFRSNSMTRSLQLEVSYNKSNIKRSIL
jgi:hypothetical protein